MVAGLPEAAVRVWPNPLNPAGTLAFQVPREGRVSVRLYSADGRQVRVLMDRRVEAGMVTIPFDGRDALGSTLASGIYFYRIEGSGVGRTGRITILK